MATQSREEQIQEIVGVLSPPLDAKSARRSAETWVLIQEDLAIADALPEDRAKHDPKPGTRWLRRGEAGVVWEVLGLAINVEDGNPVAVIRPDITLRGLEVWPRIEFLQAFTVLS